MKYINIRQLDGSDCAVSCLTSVSKYYGHDITITKLREVCKTDTKGTSLDSLYKATEKLNFDAKCVRQTIDVAEEFGKAFGGFGGGTLGGGLGTAAVSSAGYAQGLLA